MVVVFGLAFLAFNEFVGNSGGDVPIDGIKCGVQENYHIHAHLALLHRGQPMYLYAGIGRSQYGCFYALHTHDASGIIHIEAPAPFAPTLGNFFDIWHVPLSPSRVWLVKVGAGTTMRVFVNRHLYSGNPRIIKLKRHTTITLEVGPPFKPAKPYKFGTL